MIENDEGFKVLKKVRSSPAYWDQKKKELMAMIRQLGPPTFFLTLSAAEKKWPELLKYLKENQTKKHCSLKDALGMKDSEKSELIKNDPVACARYIMK